MAYKYRTGSKAKDALVVVLAVLGVLAVAVALTALVAWVLMWAWNIVVPAVFYGPTISFTTAYAFVVLVSIIRSLLSRGSK